MVPPPPTSTRRPTRLRTRDSSDLAPQEGGDGSPGWIRQVEVVTSTDAREAIAAGQHPLAQVMAAAAALAPGQAHRLITPFVPAPLLDKARAQGLQVWTEEVAPGEFHSLLARLPG